MTFIPKGYLLAKVYSSENGSAYPSGLGLDNDLRL